MSKRGKSLTLPSLAQHFLAPDDYTGHFGWLCGYSADVAFLNDAADRFTRQTTAQRAHSGRIHLAVMLDPGNPAISLLDAPGIYHALIKNATTKPFQLLHAKVALLGFRHQNDASRWWLRLIVSTGNWTRQTLEESIDLAWLVDISCEDIRRNDGYVNQCCADIRAAQDLITWIAKQFDLRLLGVTCETSSACKQVEEWITQCLKNAGSGKPRLFDNREKSLLKQLPTLISQHCADVPRNYLAMGSGFYEAATKGSVVPSVPISIVSALRMEKLLTSRPELDLFVEPTSCQAVANSVEALNDQGFTVRAAAKPQAVFGEKSQRNLHAKFLFSANCRNNSNCCNSAWLYLGSGNLTGPGFTSKASPNDGNLEAGVVLAPGNLEWDISTNNDPASVVTNLLPIQWDTEITPKEILQAGNDMPERDMHYVAAPVAWLMWIEQGEDIGILSPPPDEATTFVILSPDDQPCKRHEKGFIWQGHRPRQAMIRWESNSKVEYRGVVPVIDQFGRIAATELPKLDLEAAWWQLASFPMPPDDDEIEQDNKEDGEFFPEKAKPEKNGKSKHITYPIRQMMELIENIASKQIQLCEEDWLVWCNRLEQTLNQMKDCEVIEFFRDHLRLNPLSPLLNVPFRPRFAETAQSEQGRHYEEALGRVASAWGVIDLGAIGEAR